jgi:hypothetical protein
MVKEVPRSPAVCRIAAVLVLLATMGMATRPVGQAHAAHRAAQPEQMTVHLVVRSSLRGRVVEQVSKMLRNCNRGDDVFASATWPAHSGDGPSGHFTFVEDLVLGGLYIGVDAGAFTKVPCTSGCTVEADQEGLRFGTWLEAILYADQKPDGFIAYCTSPTVTD